MELTKYELEMMEAFWAAGRPLARHDLLEAPHHWKDSSIHIILNGMIRKGAIKAVGYEKRTKTYSRTFSPVVSRERYWAKLVLSDKHIADIAPLMAELMAEAGIGMEDAPGTLARTRDLFEGRLGK